jgi:hypothetical protein
MNNPPNRYKEEEKRKKNDGREEACQNKPDAC